MKRFGIIAGICFLSFASGCKKDLPDCEEHNWGILKILNSSSQNVRVYIDGVFVSDVLTGSYVELDHINVGSHAVHAEQISLGQTWDNSVLILQCDRLNLSFTP